MFAKDKHGQYTTIAKGTTIGSRRILKTDVVTTDEIKVRINSARDIPIMEWIKIY